MILIKTSLFKLTDNFIKSVATDSTYVPPVSPDFEIDNHRHIVGTKIIDIGTDGIYTLVELSDRRFLHYDIGGDCIDIDVYTPERYEEVRKWLESRMQKLSLEQHYLSDDWIAPGDDGYRLL